ncbi:RIP metalloprotease RseP [Granulicella sp. 5B5]|uniref:RIP metalloprotease RseP n=1 Tax=Granulicella sp. 5B5 TaxID=1617967 RepID=UPI0015F698FF|nr:RIP metalloprotease RseP [Granulicella sp. 5B5]QMV18099.1 RIP metalloprotease RseP [Granulicella sp. 5B5]
MNLFHHLSASLSHGLFVVVLFAIVLGIMVLVHEFGHFIVAKMCGVRIETFAIGFGTRLFGYVYNGTDYCIRALPLGGYVKMAGEMGGDSGTGAPDEFTSKTRFQRILIALAGPAANFALSVFLMTCAAHYHHEIDKYLNGPALVDYVPTQSAAAQAGLHTGDTITRFNNVVNPTWEQILDETALNLNSAVPISFTDNGHTVTSSIHLNGGADGGLTSDPLTDSGLIPQQQAEPITINSVASGTPAAAAGIKPDDQIARINDLAPHSLDTLHAYLKDQNGAPETLNLIRNGQPLTIHVTPALVSVDASGKQYQIGVTLKPPPVDVVQLPLGKSIKESLQDNASKSLLLVRILQGLFTRHVSVKQMSGPVGIAQQIDIAFQLGIWPLVEMTSFISINLAIFNLLPIPPLDGGMIFFLLIESIMRRDVNQELKERVYQIAFVCILCMFVFVMFNDITRLHLGH